MDASGVRLEVEGWVSADRIGSDNSSASPARPASAVVRIRPNRLQRWGLEAAQNAATPNAQASMARRAKRACSGARGGFYGATLGSAATGGGVTGLRLDRLGTRQREHASPRLLAWHTHYAKNDANGARPLAPKPSSHEPPSPKSALETLAMRSCTTSGIRSVCGTIRGRATSTNGRCPRWSAC